MSAIALEAFLARLYRDAAFQHAFRTDPRGIAAAAGLDAGQQQALTELDWDGLEFALSSFASKRRQKAPGRRRWWRWIPGSERRS